MAGIDQSLGEPANKERQEELLNGNHTVEDVFNGLRVRTTLASEPFEAGVRGGRIEELVVTEGERGHELELARFLKGDWEKTAETTPARQSIMDAIAKYDPECLRPKEKSKEYAKIQERDLGKGDSGKKGHSR